MKWQIKEHRSQIVDNFACPGLLDGYINLKKPSMRVLLTDCFPLKIG